MSDEPRDNDGFNSPLSRRQLLGTLAAGGAAALLTAPGSGVAALAAGKYAGVTLRMLTQAGVNYQPALQEFAKQFQHQTGAKVQFDFAAWETLMPKVQTDLRSASPQYDLFLDDIEFQYTVYPSLLPINQYIQKSHYNMSGFFAPIYKYGVGIGGKAGVRYGLPMTSEASVIFYRKDMISKFPTTWAEYDSLLAHHKKGGKHPLSFAGVPAQLVKLFLARYWSQGAHLLTADWKPLINGPQGVKAITMLKDAMQKYAPAGVLAWDNPQASNAFLNGDAVVLEGWSDFILGSLQDPSKSKVVNKWAIAPYPQNGTGNFTQHNVIIFKHTKNPQAAFDFAAFITSPQSMKHSLLKYGVNVARKSLYTNPSVVKQMPYMPQEARVYDRGKPFTPGLPQWLELFTDLGNGASDVLSGKASPKSAMNDVAGKWEQSIKQAKPPFAYHE